MANDLERSDVITRSPVNSGADDLAELGLHHDLAQGPGQKFSDQVLAARTSTRAINSPASRFAGIDGIQFKLRSTRNVPGGGRRRRELGFPGCGCGFLRGFATLRRAGVPAAPRK